MDRQPKRENGGPKSWRRRGKRSANVDGEQDMNEAPDLSKINSEFHIVYKRQDTQVDHMSDYRKLSILGNNPKK